MNTHLAARLRPIDVLRHAGVYTAAEGTPGYAALAALLATKRVRLLGERYDRRGARVVTVRSDGPGARLNPEMTIGPEFFVTAMDDYTNWPEKWWREAIQNAVDAGATRIDCTHARDAAGNHVVACRDDGRGMDQETLLTKFLVLGGSTKKLDSGAAGGFGKAKELMLLPWLEWRVHTRDQVAAGAGTRYEVAAAPRLAGTEVRVVMPDTYRRGVQMFTTAAMALGYVKKCWLPGVRFTVNGEPVKADLKARDEVRRIGDKAVLYTAAQDYERSSYMVRVKGLFMFDEWLDTSAPVQLLVELTRPSTELLSANRDGFRDYEIKREMSKVSSEAATDAREVMRSKKGLVRQKFTGSGKFSTAADVQAAQAKADDRTAESLVHVGAVGPHEVLSAAQASALMGMLAQALAEDGTRDALGAADPGAAAVMVEDGVVGAARAEATAKLLVWTPDFYVVNDVEGFRVPRKFYPATMTPQVLTLARTWTELCRFVLIQLGCGREFGVGFEFSLDHAASCVMEPDGTRWLLLNPFRDVRARDKLWAPARDVDLRWLYAAAIHEVTHLATDVRQHNDAFAIALTDNIARCADGFRKIKRIAASLRARGGKDDAP